MPVFKSRRIPLVHTGHKNEAATGEPRAEVDSEVRAINRCIEHAVRLGLTDGVILNVGSGYGELAIRLARRCPEITVLGVEASSMKVGYATEAAERAGVQQRVHFQTAHLHSTRFKAEYFDGVLSHGMLHEAEDPIAWLNEMARIAKRDSAILIWDFRRPSPVSVWWHLRWFGRGYPAEKKEEFYSHVRAAFSYSEWRRILEQSNLQTSARIFVHGLLHMGIERPAQASLRAQLAARREQREYLAETEAWRKNI